MGEQQEPTPTGTAGAAQDTPQRYHHYHSPVDLRNGRETGAWAYGVACGISCEPTQEGALPAKLRCAIRADYLDGAAAAIVGAGGVVRRVSTYEQTYPAAEGEVWIEVGTGG